MKKIEELKKLKEFSETLIGKKYDEIIHQLREDDINFRVRKYNGQPQMCTCDMRMDRLNFVIENDLITKVTFG